MTGRRFDFDYFVIGAGSGGVRSARIAAQHGARVAIAEERYYGGTCVNVGCVPKKLMAMAAHYAADFDDAAGFGWTVGDRSHDWTTLIANKDREIARLNEIYRSVLSGSGCTLFDARATFLDPHTLAVGDRRITAERVLIAAGGWPTVPDIPGAQDCGMTSNDVFRLRELPKRIVIVGGGYIAVEFAGIFHGLGSEVVVVHRGAQLLRGFDHDVRSHLGSEMSRRGVALVVGVVVLAVDRTLDGLSIGLSDGQVLEADAVLFATGRHANTAGLGLEAAGVRTAPSGAIPVDAQYRTNVDHIFAIGDVTDRINLTPVAIAEGHALADSLFGSRPRILSYDDIPSAVFSDPPVGTVGLTEDQARERYGAVDIYRSTFRPMRHTMSGREVRSLFKLVVDRATDRVVGCHLVGEDAPEILQGFAVALVAGATKAQFDRTIGIHPTAAEEFVTMRSKLAG
jgi:glutathione reductase (NADPH)